MTTDSLNTHFPTEELSDWRSGIWTCENGHTAVSVDEPDHLCDRYDGACGHEWEESVLAARYPRNGEWGVIKCGRCGDEFIELNSEHLGGWFCNDCGGLIVPRSTPVRDPEANEPVETEQSALPIAATDGGVSSGTDTKQIPDEDEQ